MTKTKKAKRYPYYGSVSWTKGKTTYTINTQMYAVGLYVAVTQDGQPYHQFTSDPKKFGKAQESHIQDLRNSPDIKDVHLGQKVAAFEDASGFWDTEEIT